MRNTNIHTLKPAPLKSGALIIADSQSVISKIEAQLLKHGWPSDGMSARSMIGQGTLSAMNHHCVILVIDHHFRKSFSGLMIEMSAVIRNISTYKPVYLLLENDDETVVSSWQRHVKAIFKSALQADSLHQALQHIVHSESGAVHAPAAFRAKHTQALATHTV